MTNIGATLRIRGEMSSDEDLRIDGHVSGTIEIREGALTIGPSASIAADVRGRQVTVEGTVEGHVVASDRITLTETAKVAGSLSADTIAVVDGASFNGRIDMGRRSIASAVAHHRGQPD
ncbi:MAG: polymer-forming cytoskeletal protein [Acidimicrobiia bacterium]|nr:polymer-forming cytoskeletal protein [Acidimicrobiia bacterium]